nr:ABC transporter substrate-binding protein [Actinomadura sp. CNU-125]
MDRRVPVRDVPARGIGRRGLLAGVGAIAAAGLLGGCGSGSGGGDRRFRAAFAAGGSQETMDPHVAPNFVDQVRAKAMYDTLAAFGDDMSVRARLAESWESDRSGTRWRVRLRSAKFHDGAPVTAADVLYTYRRVADPATGSPSQQLMTAVDFAASRGAGRELTLVLKRPDFGFPRVLAGVGTEILPAGTTSFRDPVGSGPFRFGSFTPGGPALFTRWDGHWDGPPKIAELEIVPANEEAARVNALLSGQVHYAADLAGASVNRLKGERSARLLTAPRATAQQILLSRGRAPFATRAWSRRSGSASTGRRSSGSRWPGTARSATTCSARAWTGTRRASRRANATSDVRVRSSGRRARRGWRSRCRPARWTRRGNRRRR